MVKMDGLLRFRDDVTMIVSELVNAVMKAGFPAAEKRQESPTEDRLETLVKALCAEAVEKILLLVDVAPPPPHCDITQQSGDALLASPASQGEDDRSVSAPSDHNYILLYESDLSESSGSLLLSLQSPALPDAKVSSQSSAQRETSCSSTRSLNSQSSAHHVVSSDGETTGVPLRSSGPLTDVTDHTYAQADALQEAAAGNQTRHGDVCAEVRCSFCGMFCPNSERLRDHQRRSHPACSLCGAVFTGVMKLRHHELKEHGLLPFACDFCPKRFTHKAHRDAHVKARHTSEKSCLCDICGKGYASVSVMKTHRVTHFDKTFVCDVCGKSFYHAYHLTRHKLLHQQTRPHRCATCGKGFTQAANLRSHQAMHADERQLCAICGKSYRCLKNHVISKHPHEVPAAAAVADCVVCGKKFASRSQLRVHQRSHTGEKPYHCDICGKSYRLKEMLRDHRRAHMGLRPYTCSLCAKTFSRASSFNRHRGVHGAETPHGCSVCGKQFRLLTFLKAHLLTKAHLRRATLTSDPSVTS